MKFTILNTTIVTTAIACLRCYKTFRVDRQLRTVYKRNKGHFSANNGFLSKNKALFSENNRLLPKNKGHFSGNNGRFSKNRGHILGNGAPIPK